MTPSASLWKLGVAAAALLAIGAALGIAADRLHHRQPAAVAPSGLGQNGLAASLAFIDSVLALSPNQREEVHRLLAQRQAPIDSIWAHTHGALLASLDTTVKQVLRVLDARQQALFRKIFDDQALHGATRGRP